MPEMPCFDYQAISVKGILERCIVSGQSVSVNRNAVVPLIFNTAYDTPTPKPPRMRGNCAAIHYPIT